MIHIDGGSRGNPGPAGAGVVIQTDEGVRVHEAGYFLGVQTNNAAEYQALLFALQRAQRCPPQPLSVCSDSELLVRQITGEYQVKSPKLAQLHQQAQLLLLRTARWSIKHVPREENRRADQLANLAMDRRETVIVYDSDGGGAGEPPAGAPPVETRSAAPAPPAGATAAAQAAPEPDSAKERPAARETVVRDAAPHARPVRLTVARPPAPASCPAGNDWPAQAWTVEATLPAGLCVHAAHAIVPTLLAIQNTDAQEYAAVPTLTVRCNRPGCGATFHLSPLRPANGSPAKENS